MHATDTRSAQQRIVRDYTSTRAFDADAKELYARTGYTVSQTAGMPHRGLRRVLSSFWPREDHLVITYQAPTIARAVQADMR
jgi:hypothetical protein